ncbi:hypothetical protein [Methanobrevibacter sp.]|nr:hypothetical protein [Methanobrevibacter sp.]
MVKRNQKLHNPFLPLLIGNIEDSDVANEINWHSYIDMQQT